MKLTTTRIPHCLLMGVLVVGLTGCDGQEPYAHGGLTYGNPNALEARKPPDPKLIDMCLADLNKNKAYQCVSGLVGPMIPTRAQMEACGCTFTGTGNGTGVGPRPIYYCPGTPPFFVSPVPGNGNLGIIVPDGTKYPECMFDITKGDGGVGPIYTPMPGNNCLSCHDRGDPVMPLPSWGSDGGWPGWPLPDMGTTPDAAVKPMPMPDMTATVMPAVTSAP